MVIWNGESLITVSSPISRRVLMTRVFPTRTRLSRLVVGVWAWQLFSLITQSEYASKTVTSSGALGAERVLFEPSRPCAHVDNGLQGRNLAHAIETDDNGWVLDGLSCSGPSAALTQKDCAR